MAGLGEMATGAELAGSRVASLYAAHVPGARRFAYLLTGDRALAEDLAHEAFIRVAGRLWALRSPDAFPADLRKAVLNEVRRHARGAGRERARAERSARLETPSPAGDGVQLDRYGELWDALAQLPERQRAAIVLRFWLDVSEHRAAELLGCRRGTVKSLVSRGLTTVRELIADG